ncbi:glutathione transferase GST 23-like [Eucalyptus grandis]|uniref:glutathione transferase GST 23-like n=1 Tax=Eucalyptus grandis TaxID=71139 RepID=UPI00192EE138|nr:glutathione transferase GST 23-like [Eucalyptus grandis]
MVPRFCNTVILIIRLFYQGKLIAKSLVILEYINETWKQKALLPQDPHDRAKAPFWAKFVDDKCMPAIISIFRKKGEDQQRAAKEAQQNLKILEGGLEKKPFFGGDTINIVDIAGGSMWYCVRAVEVHIGINLVDAEDMSLLSSWFQRFIDISIIKEYAPLWGAILEHKEGLQKMLMALST